MTSKAITTFNQWQLRPLMYGKTTGVYGESTAPLLSGLLKKLVDVSGDPRERQWLHQRLSQAVARGNAASILACVRVWSNFTCSFSSSCFQRTDHHHCLPLAPVTMCSYCLPNPRSFSKIHCSLSCAVLPCALVKYLANRMTYDESTAGFRVQHCFKPLRPLIFWKKNICKKQSWKRLWRNY